MPLVPNDEPDRTYLLPLQHAYMGHHHPATPYTLRLSNATMSEATLGDVINFAHDLAYADVKGEIGLEFRFSVEELVKEVVSPCLTSEDAVYIDSPTTDLEMNLIIADLEKALAYAKSLKRVYPDPDDEATT